MILLLKILCIYLLTIAIMRLMGKSTIIQMTPYDLVAIIIVGTMASEPLISTEFRPTLYALVISYRTSYPVFQVNLIPTY